MQDKLIERDRYDNSSREKLATLREHTYYTSLWDKSFPEYLLSPYKYYHETIKTISYANCKQLDLCCGDGIHSFTGAFEGAEVTALDYAEGSIEIAKKRSTELGVKVNFKVADVEKLSFDDEQFNLVTCASSLSYLESQPFISEVFRVLKKNGAFVCVDSFNYNPIYKLNRFVHYLKGERTFSTLKRMPDYQTITLINELFTHVEVNYFGIFSFLAPFLSKIFGTKKASNIIDQLDKRFSFLKKFAFKIVIKAIK